MCERVVHLKCIKLKHLTVDDLKNRNDYHYFCPDCNVHIKNLTKCFDQVSRTMAKIEKSFTTISTDFVNCREAFQKFKLLENSAPLKEKLNSNKSKSAKTKAIKTQGIKSWALFPSSDSPPSPSPLVNPLISPSPIPIINLIEPSPPSHSMVPPTSGTSNHPKILRSSSPTTFKSPQSASSLKASLSVSTSYLNNSNPNSRAPNSDLYCIPQNKRVFVSRLPESTTEDNIRSHLLNKLKGTDLSAISVRKIRMNTTGIISSFIINVPPNLFDIISKPSAWPPNCFVRQSNTPFSSSIPSPSS